MGSASFKNIKYPADYDLFETVYEGKQSLQQFKQRVKQGFIKLANRLAQDSDEEKVYFIEFKGGLKHGEKRNWILSQLHAGTGLETLLDEKSVIKIDVVAYIGAQFIPFSNVFEFRYNNGKGINQEEETRDSVNSLMDDVLHLRDKGKWWKVLKRLFVIAQVQKKKQAVNKLLKVFNTDLGMLAQLHSRLEAAHNVWQRYQDATTEVRVRNYLQTVKESLSTISDPTIPNIWFDRLDRAYNAPKGQLGGYIDGLLREINTLVQAQSKRILDGEASLKSKVKDAAAGEPSP